MSKRFLQAMNPSLLLGVLINLCNVGLFLYVQAIDLIISPAISVLIFAACFYLMRNKRMQPKVAFLIGASTVLIELTIHTYVLGWDGGFYYFVCLLPIIFFLNTSWKIWFMIAFNLGVVILLILLFFFRYDADAIINLSVENQRIVQVFNGLGTSIAVIIVLIYFSRVLVHKDEQLTRANLQLAKQNESILEKNKEAQLLLKEIHHRVKNNLQIISSLISLQYQSIQDKKVAEVLSQTKRRVDAIALIQQKLYKDDRINQVDFHAYLKDIMQTQQLLGENVRYDLIVDEITMEIDTALPLGLLVSELITNALKHAFEGTENPILSISCKKEADAYLLEVKDNGIGLPDQFTLEEPTTLGSELIAALANQIGARIEFRNENGAVFTISVPQTPKYE